MRRKFERRNTLRALRDALLTIFVLAAAFAAWRFVFSAGGGPQAGTAFSPLPTATGTLPGIVIPLPAATAHAISTNIANRIHADETLRAPSYTPDVTPDWPKLNSDRATREARPRPTVAFFSSLGDKPAGAGRFGPGQPAFYNKQIATTNGWYEESAGGTVRTLVTVGATWQDWAQALPSRQGLVFVQVLQLDQARLNINLTYMEEFLTPTASGELTITGAQGERLILQSSDGTTFYFDVPTRQFVASLDATVTPPPTTGPESPLPTATPLM